MSVSQRKEAESEYAIHLKDMNVKEFKEEQNRILDLKDKKEAHLLFNIYEKIRLERAEKINN